MKNIVIKPSTARMLMPGLSDRFPPNSTPLNPMKVRKIQTGDCPQPTMTSLPPVIVGRMAKGGVGKTTVIGNVGSALAMMGHKVLMVDGDPQATLTGLMGVDWMKDSLVHIGILMHRTYHRQPVLLEQAIERIYPDGHLDLIPADITLTDAESWMMGAANREQLFVRLLRENQGFFSRYDCILVDTAPATCLLTNALMMATREIVAVAWLDGSSVKALRVLNANIVELNAAFPDLNMNIHIVANGWHGSYKICQSSLEELSAQWPGHVCETVIPNAAPFRRQISPHDDGETGTVIEKEPDSQSAEVIAELTRTLANRYGVGFTAQENSPEAGEVA